MELSLKNVKFHFAVNHPLSIPDHLLNRESTKKHVNFFVIWLKTFVYIIFPSAGHVNVSGVPSFESISIALKEFNAQFGYAIQRSDIKIDNTTASGRFARFDFPKLLKHCSKNHPDYRISVRTDFFPSIILRPSSLSRRQNLSGSVGLSTCIIFSNGKYIIVGAKSIDSIRHTFSHANTFVSSSWI